MLENVIADIKAYDAKSQKMGLLKRILFLCLTQEMYPVLIYRYGRWAGYRLNVPIVKYVLRFVYILLQKASEIFLHVFICPEQEIGPGLRLEHQGFIGIVGKLGRNCRTSSLVIVGHVGAFEGGGVPVLGDQVWVGAGAKVLREIKIGNNVIIGANAVVTHDIPDNAVVVGVPGRVIRIRSDDEVLNWKFR